MSLRQIYNSKILPQIKTNLEELERLKTSQRKTSLFVLAFSVPVFVFFLKFDPSSTFIVLLLILVVFVLTIKPSLKESSKLKNKILLVVTDEISRYHNPGLKCYPNNFIGDYSFNRSGLFKKPDRLSGSMLVDGVVDGIPLAFSYVHAQEKEEETEYDDDGCSHTKTYYSTIFSGLFIKFKPPLKVSANVVIRPAGLMKGLTSVFGSPGDSGLVEFESPEFNRKFTVRASDIVDAHMVVTPRFMERYLKLKYTLERSIYMSIVPEWVYVAVSGIKTPYRFAFSNPADLEFVEEFDRYVSWGIYIFRELMDILPLRIEDKETRI